MSAKGQLKTAIRLSNKASEELDRETSNVVANGVMLLEAAVRELNIQEAEHAENLHGVERGAFDPNNHRVELPDPDEEESQA